MTKFFMLIGFPGSGKSTVAKELSERYNAVICSSDALRKELFGSEAVQDHNEEVFEILSKRMIECLKEGKSVIYDAMNISRKYRRTFLDRIKKIDCEKIGVIIATPYEKCLEQNNMRERHVPEWAIKRAYMNFETPCLQEGFNEIRTIYHNSVKKFKTIEETLNSCKIDHDNPHHILNIYDHMQATNRAYCNSYTYDHDSVYYATLIHDIGKPFCKTFKNRKGEDSDVAHYYSHSNVGAYETLFIDLPEALKLNISLLINYHMKFFEAYENSEKAYLKDKKFLGEDFMKDLEILHECDLAGDKEYE